MYSVNGCDFSHIGASRAEVYSVSRREKIVAGTGVAVLLVAVGLLIAGAMLSHRIEPYIRQRAEDYLRTKRKRMGHL